MPKMYCAGTNFLSQSKNLIPFSASSKTFIPAQKLNLLNGNILLVHTYSNHVGARHCQKPLSVKGSKASNFTVLVPCPFTGPKMF